jgi:DME family drug/metabolite transporter
VLAGAALFGTIGTAQAVGPDAPPPQLAAVRLLVAGLLLMLLALGTGHLAQLSRSVRESPTWWAGLGQAGFNLCFLGAMVETGVAVGTLVAIGATPILTGLVTRQVSRLWLTATCVAVTGLVLLVGGQAAGDAGASVPGIALALGASASYATYIIAGNAALARGLPVQPYLAVAFCVAALLTAPLLVCGDLTWLWTGRGALLVLYMALVPTVLAYSLFNRGLAGVRPSTASTLGLIEPVVAACLAVVVVGERLSALGVAGAVLVVVGLVLIVRSVRASDVHVPTEIG